MKEKPSIISCHFRGIKGLLMISIFLFDKFRKTHSHQHAISRVLWFFKFWIWICQIHKDSLTPTCDFPGSKDFQVLNLNLSNSERLTHTIMRFPGFYGFWSFEKKNINSRLTPLIFKIGRRKGYLIFLITVGVWKKILTQDSHHSFSK